MMAYVAYETEVTSRNIIFCSDSEGKNYIAETSISNGQRFSAKIGDSVSGCASLILAETVIKRNAFNQYISSATRLRTFKKQDGRWALLKSVSRAK